jgi:Cu/Ag efflux protein CusF
VRLGIVAALVSSLVGCRGGGAAPPPPPTTAPAVVVYPLRGVVKAVAADRRSVTLDHEEIPGLMAAMEMEFAVADPSVLAGIAPGARVEGDLRVRGRAPEITRLQTR